MGCGPPLRRPHDCTNGRREPSWSRSCFPHPIRRLRRHLPHFVEKGRSRVVIRPPRTLGRRRRGGGRARPCRTALPSGEGARPRRSPPAIAGFLRRARGRRPRRGRRRKRAGWARAPMFRLRARPAGRSFGAAPDRAGRPPGSDLGSDPGVTAARASSLRSISPLSKPIAERSKSRSRRLSSSSSTPSRFMSQEASSVSRLSAIMKARRSASLKWSRAMVGISARPRRRAASTRPWPATTRLSPSIRTETLKPKASMLSAMRLTWPAGWRRALRGSGSSASTGSQRPRSAGSVLVSPCARDLRS